MAGCKQHRQRVAVSVLLLAILHGTATPVSLRAAESDAALEDTITAEILMNSDLAPSAHHTAFDKYLPLMNLQEIKGPNPPVRPDRDAVIALTGRTIVRVTVENPLPGFDPVSDAAVPLGIPFHAELVRTAVTRLFDTGRYRDIQIGARALGEDQVELVISVLPMLRIRKLTIRGNSAVKNDDAARAIEYTSGRTIQPDREVLRVLRQKLLDYYARIGYREAQATLSLLTTAEPGGVELVIDIVEGRPDRYTTVNILGLPDDVPEQSIGVSKGFNRNPEKINKLEQRLLSVLAQYGYLDAATAPIEERRIGKYAFEATLTVKAGLRSQILFRGSEHFLSRNLEEVIESDGPMRTDAETLTRKAARIKQHLVAHGFLFAQVDFEKRCLHEGQMTTAAENDNCRPTAESQEITFRIREGKVVDVVNVFFAGNEQFTDEALENELLAFIGGKNKSDDLFQPISSETLNALGVSDKRRGATYRDSDFKAPRFRRQRVYVPEQYADAVNHLIGVYQEQGYLSASVDDMCDLDTRDALQYRHMTFTPIRFSRISEDSELTENSNRAPCVLVNRDKDQLLVMMQVTEGPQTTVSELRFKGNRRLPSAELQKACGISVDSPYNEYRLREAGRKITEKYRSLGYMFVDVTWKKSFSQDMHRAGVLFTINEGPLTKVGIIRVEGAETTSIRLIRERLTLKPGDIITPAALEKSQTLLMELGIFNGATVQLVSPEIKDTVKNLKVQVSEAKPQYLELKWGIATVEGVRGSLEYGFNNLGGLALSVALRARANYRLFFFGAPDFEQRYNEMTLMEQLEHHVLAGLGSPHIPRTNGILGWGIDLIKERLNKPGFSASRFTTFLRLNAKLGIGRKYPHGLVFSGRVGMENNLDISPGLKTENPELKRYLRLPEGSSAFSVFGLGIALDLRDSPFNPTKGFYLAVDGDWVHSLSFIQGSSQDWIEGDSVPIEDESNLIRAQATLSGYVPLFGSDIVLAMSVTAGYIFHLQTNSTTWPDRYFYVGGVDTLRGFPEDDLVPEDIYQHWKSMLNSYGGDIDELLNNRGGEAMFITRAELRYPLAKGFYGAGFAEFGNLWRDGKKMQPIEFSPALKIHLRPVAGIGIRYQTPLGPVAFDLGVNLYRRPTELPLSWYISIGSAF